MIPTGAMTKAEKFNKSYSEHYPHRTMSREKLPGEDRGELGDQVLKFSIAQRGI